MLALLRLLPLPILMGGTSQETHSSPTLLCLEPVIYDSIWQALLLSTLKEPVGPCRITVIFAQAMHSTPLSLSYHGLISCSMLLNLFKKNKPFPKSSLHKNTFYILTRKAAIHYANVALFYAQNTRAKNLFIQNFSQKMTNRKYNC